MGKSLKAQMKYADKLGAKYSIALGDDEIESGKAVLKNIRCNCYTRQFKQFLNGG